MAIHLSRDTMELARLYEIKNEAPYLTGRVLLDKLAIQSGQTVLDIGCGTGRLARDAAELIGADGQLYGIDPMADRIAIALEKNNSKQAVFRTGIAEDLSFLPSDSVDAAYMSWVFHWVADKKQALEEAKRVLKQGARLGITLSPLELNRGIGMNKIMDGVLARKPYGSVVDCNAAPQYSCGCTTTGLIELLTGSGLFIQKIQIQPGVRSFASAADAIVFFEAGLFGNFLNHVPEELRQQAKADIQTEFEKYRTAEGLEFDFYTLYAIAQKPGACIA